MFKEHSCLKLTLGSLEVGRAGHPDVNFKQEFLFEIDLGLS